MNYVTPHGSVNVRGRKLVVETNNEVTKISMLEGDSTVRAGPQDLGGLTVRAGEQAVIRPNPAGGPNIIQVTRIPPAELPRLDEKVTMACMAKRTVYFEERERPMGGNRGGGDNTPTGADGADAEGPGAVTAFDGGSNSSNVNPREIVPVAVVPVNLPVQFTVSPATLVNPARTVTPPGIGIANPTPGP